MKQPWKYLIVRLVPRQNVIAQEHEFDIYGEDGWELVAIRQGRAYFKKRHEVDELDSVLNTRVHLS